MNKERRKSLEGALLELRQVKDALEKIPWGKVNDWLESAKTAIEETKDEEQETFDNLSEGLQAAERGQRMEEVVDTLENQLADIDEILQRISDDDSFIVGLDDIIGEVEGCLE